MERPSLLKRSELKFFIEIRLKEVEYVYPD